MIISLTDDLHVDLEAIAYCTRSQEDGLENLFIVMNDDESPAIELIGPIADVAWGQLQECTPANWVKIAGRYLLNVDSTAYCELSEDSEVLRIVFKWFTRDSVLRIAGIDMQVAWEQLQWVWCENAHFVELSDRFLVDSTAIAFCVYSEERTTNTSCRIFLRDVQPQEDQIYLYGSESADAWLQLLWDMGSELVTLNYDINYLLVNPRAIANIGFNDWRDHARLRLFLYGFDDAFEVELIGEDAKVAKEVLRQHVPDLFSTSAR